MAVSRCRRSRSLDFVFDVVFFLVASKAGFCGRKIEDRTRYNLPEDLIFVRGLGDLMMAQIPIVGHYLFFFISVLADRAIS